MNRGVAWIGIASAFVGIFDLVAIVLITRLWISPEQYGIAATAALFFPILDQATDLGLMAALVQRDDLDDAKVSTVFWINLICAALLFGVILACAPLFSEAIVGSLLIAYGTKLLWQNIYSIPFAMLKKELRFKELSIIRILANVAELAAKIGFAPVFGIWCFVLGPLARVLVSGIGGQICYPWRPKLILRLAEAREFIRFGLKSSASQILFYCYTNVDYLIVKQFFGNTALGLYKLAYEVALEPVRMISFVIIDIAFPTFAKLRYARDQLIAQLVSFTRLNLITVLTYSVIVFVTVNDLLAIFYPDFVHSASTARILCVVAVLRAVGFVIPPLLDGVGQPGRTLRYMLWAAVMLPLCFVGFAYFLGDAFGSSVIVTKAGTELVTDGYIAVAIGWGVGYPIAFAVLVTMAMKTLSWTASAFVRSIIGVMGCMIAAGCVGAGIHALLGELPALARFVVTTIAIAGATGLLLAYTQGMSPRTMVRALKGRPATQAVDPGPPVD
ncbi:MAG: oligosaccharide flippase family protein [Kofleriaceae bacterium]